MIPASEEHRHTKRSFEIVRCLFPTQDVDIEQVIAEIDVKGDRVSEQEPKTRAEVDCKSIVISEICRAQTGDQIKIGVVGATFADENLTGQYVVAEIEVVIGQRAIVE